MKKLPSFLSAEPSSARLSDRPPEPKRPSWWKIIGWMTVLLVFGPYLFLGCCFFVGWSIQSTIDHLNGPLHLDAAVKLPSPDNHIRFEADTDGTVRVMQIATGRLVHKQRIPVEDYHKIDARWQENSKIGLTCYLRYPVMALFKEYVWDCQSGVLKDSVSGEAMDAQ
jgi:hypothetical protein